MISVMTESKRIPLGSDLAKFNVAFEKQNILNS
jgi:hypothetical protein